MFEWKREGKTREEEEGNRVNREERGKTGEGRRNEECLLQKKVLLFFGPVCGYERIGEV